MIILKSQSPDPGIHRIEMPLRVPVDELHNVDAQSQFTLTGRTSNSWQVDFAFFRILKRGIEQKATKVTKVTKGGRR